MTLDPKTLEAVARMFDEEAEHHREVAERHRDAENGDMAQDRLDAAEDSSDLAARVRAMAQEVEAPTRAAERDDADRYQPTEQQRNSLPEAHWLHLSGVSANDAAIFLGDALADARRALVYAAERSAAPIMIQPRTAEQEYQRGCTDERERIALMFDEDVEKARSDADGLRSRGVEPVAQGYRARDALKVAARIRAMGDHVDAAKGGA